jgi:inorganic pyrophosphatase
MNITEAGKRCSEITSEKHGNGVLIMIDTDQFWEYLQKLVDTNKIIIDRPKGTHHPRFPDLLYKWDYGHIENTKSMDKSGIDVFMGSLSNKIIDTLLVTIDLYKNDSEIKLLIGCTEYEKKEILAFMNSTTSMKAIMINKTVKIGESKIEEIPINYNSSDLFVVYGDVIYDPTNEHIQEELAQYNGNDKILYGYFVKNKLIGIIGINKLNDYIEILHLGVHPDYRSKGIGTQLIDYVKKMGKTIKLETDGDAVIFYKNYGFTTVEFHDERYPQVTRYKCEYTQRV